jgi:hypothetical protein
MLVAMLLALCSAQDAAAADKALHRFRVPSEASPGSWARFKGLVDKHGRCTDGALAEFWDDDVTAMFDKQWIAALRFKPLRKNKKLRTFVARFHGGTADQYAVRRVLKRANHCARRDDAFCGWVRDVFTH